MQKTLKRLIYIYFLTIFINSYGQKQGNIWYFGDGAGVSFNSGVPVGITGGQTYLGTGHNEGTSSICDSSGALLFYSNGEKAWNRNHQIMPNGDSLLGHYSSTQSSLIVPQPGSDNIFYLFTTDSWHINNLKNGFRYSKIDMCLDNELGDVIINQKNVLLLDTVSEKLTVVKHFNNVDYWIITHKYYSDKFYAYKLTSTGITDTVISAIGSFHEDNCGVPVPDPTRAAIGQMKASPNGAKLALTTLNTCDNLKELFDFDKSTGIVANFINLELLTDTFGGYGVSFSPDNSKLYIASNSPGKIYQYNLTAGGGNPDSIRNSKIKVVDIASPILGIQLGPDGKIYTARANNFFLAVINNPNTSGFACNFIDAAVSLTGISSYGMPNLIDGYNYHNKMTQCDLGVSNDVYQKNINISPNPFSTQTTLYSDIYLHNVTLTVYNSFGQAVKQLKNINGQTITLHRDNLPSGLYFIRITEGDKIFTTEKLIITDN